MGEKVINMTPHPITICDDDGNILRQIMPCGRWIRLSHETVSAGFDVDGIPVTVTKFGDPIGLPPYEEGVFYVVSQLVKNALTDRQDLLVPAETVRDERGRIIGCRSLGA